MSLLGLASGTTNRGTANPKDKDKGKDKDKDKGKSKNKIKVVVGSVDKEKDKVENEKDNAREGKKVIPELAEDANVVQFYCTPREVSGR